MCSAWLWLCNWGYQAAQSHLPVPWKSSPWVTIWPARDFSSALAALELLENPHEWLRGPVNVAVPVQDYTRDPLRRSVLMGPSFESVVGFVGENGGNSSTATFLMKRLHEKCLSLQDLAWRTTQTHIFSLWAELARESWRDSSILLWPPEGPYIVLWQDNKKSKIIRNGDSFHRSASVLTNTCSPVLPQTQGKTWHEGKTPVILHCIQSKV